MIIVKYTRYKNDYDKHEEIKSFHSLNGVADWLFNLCEGSYKDGMFFVDPDWKKVQGCTGKFLDSSCISVRYDGTGYCTWVQQIEDSGIIIYSTGKHTNNISHWNETIKQWLRDCRTRQLNPQFNFG